MKQIKATTPTNSPEAISTILKEDSATKFIKCNNLFVWSEKTIL